jgi:hypothetical protein
MLEEHGSSSAHLPSIAFTWSGPTLRKGVKKTVADGAGFRSI